MSSVTAQDLRTWLDQQPCFRGEDWVRSLEPRKQHEAGFHDADREGSRDLHAESSPNRRFYEAAGVVRGVIDDWIRAHVPGATFLDYACGNGSMTLLAARAGAELAVGIDISAVSIQGAQGRAEREGLGERTRFLQRDCEATELPAESFDACLCSGMLHHLDLGRAFPELYRIMKPSGKVLCAEALAYNPVIQLYRERTPKLRTPWEKDHILSLRELRFASRWFRVENVRFHLMLAPLATLLPRGVLRRWGLTIGQGLDAVLTRIPGLRLWSWQFTFELVRTE